MRYLEVIIFLLVVGSAKSQSVFPKQPNIILIMADDLGYQALGCYGNDDKLTPNLDRLANSGMRFEHCYATPLCTPSRVQLMTGKYNHRNYIGFGLLDAKETSFGHLLKMNGYRTCIAGKWQLYGNHRQQALAGGKKGTLPEDAGFDAYSLWQVRHRGSRYGNPKIHTKGEGTKVHKGRFGPDVFTSYILDFMEESNAEPFFIYYPMVLTHNPFIPTPQLPEYGAAHKGNRGDQEYFNAMIHYMDFLVGRIIDKIDELGIRENTVIIFTSDNGSPQGIPMSYKGVEVVGKKGKTCMGGTRVPLIVSCPNSVPQGITNNSLIDFTDFLPTLLDLSGTRSHKFHLDGKSFFPQLTGNNSSSREWVFCYYDPKWGGHQPAIFVHDSEWKLYSDGRIYHVSEDPEEIHPIGLSQLSQSDQTTISGFQKVIHQLLK